MCCSVQSSRHVNGYRLAVWGSSRFFGKRRQNSLIKSTAAQTPLYQGFLKSSSADPASIASTSQVGRLPLPLQVLPARSQ